jgi:hypothetical protein
MMERHPQSTYLPINCGQRLHNVERETVTASLREDLDSECAGPWFAVVMHADGSGFMRGTSDFTPPPPEEPLARMIDLAVMLNRAMHMDGHWIVVWSNHMLSAYWRDGDGDLQFTWGVDEPWVRISRWETMRFATRAAYAWDRWKEHMRRQQFSPTQAHKRALGEAAPLVRLP